MDIKTEKTRARLQAKQKRAISHNSRDTMAAGIELIHHWPASLFPRPSPHACIIGGYWPLPGELDVRPLLDALFESGQSLALPCTPRKGHPLTFRSWAPDAPLKAGPYGTREPYPEAATVPPDIMLVPLLAFTERGERLGYGGGFYDRTLTVLRESHTLFACGVAYDAQKADHLPTDPHDIRLDGIITETGFRKFT